MKFLKRIFLGLVAIIAALLVGSFFLPQHVSVHRAITIRAEGDVVFVYVNSLREFNEWSPWAVRDPDMELTFTGPESGVGAGMEWRSDEPGVGTGSEVIIESRPYEYVNLSLDFGDQGSGTSDFRLNTGEGRTRVTWGFETDLGYNPIARYMGLMFDGWIGPDYELGLRRLKSLVETGSPTGG